MDLWQFMSNQANSGAISAMSALVQATTAVISLLIVGLLTVWNLMLVKTQNEQIDKQHRLEQNAARKMTYKVAFVLLQRLSRIAAGLDGLAYEGLPSMLVMDGIHKGLTDEMIVEHLDYQTVSKVFQWYASFSGFYDNLVKFYDLGNGDVVTYKNFGEGARQHREALNDVVAELEKVLDSSVSVD